MQMQPATGEHTVADLASGVEEAFCETQTLDALIPKNCSRLCSNVLYSGVKEYLDTQERWVTQGSDKDEAPMTQLCARYLFAATILKVVIGGVTRLQSFDALKTVDETKPPCIDRCLKGNFRP